MGREKLRWLWILNSEQKTRKSHGSGLRHQAMTSQTEGHVTYSTQVTFVSLDGQTEANSEVYTTDLFNREEIERESQYANLHATSNQDLHTTSGTHNFLGDDQTERNENNAMLECLPEFNTVNKPFVIRWGKQSDETAIFYLTSDIIEAYDEITAWRKNVFLVPYGRAGRDFIDQISLHINEWNNSPDNQHVTESRLCTPICRTSKAKP